MEILNLGKVAIVGAGALGGYYGAKLAKAGADVYFLARSDFEVLRTRGLEVRSGDETFLQPVQVAAHPSDIGPCDWVIVALKTTSNAALDTLIPPLLHDGTNLVTLQNGLGNEEYLADRFGAERVLGGLCFVCINRIAPGVLEHYGHGTLSLGEFGRAAQDRTRALVAAFAASGIETRCVDHLAEERWRKLVWNIPFNGLSIAAGGVDCGSILANPALEQEVRELMRETIHAANAQGFPVPADYEEFQMQRTYPMGAYKPSSMLDFLAGNPVELEAIWGEPLRRAQAVGAGTPRLALLYALLTQLVAAK